VFRQSNAALANVKGCLKEAGVTDLKAVIKVTVYITDVSKLSEVSTSFSLACSSLVG
jgi:enamine deaminase RidA (YjgF/YER057c/UK114 family)